MVLSDLSILREVIVFAFLGGFSKTEESVSNADLNAVGSFNDWLMANSSASSEKDARCFIKLAMLYENPPY